MLSKAKVDGKQMSQKVSQREGVIHQEEPNGVKILTMTSGIKHDKIKLTVGFESRKR